MMREGYEMDSPKVGVLEVGETVMVAERRENEASIFRCKFIAPNGAICWCVLNSPYGQSRLPGSYLSACLDELMDLSLRLVYLQG
jgi:hypothetical protein